MRLERGAPALPASSRRDCLRAPPRASPAHAAASICRAGNGGVVAGGWSAVAHARACMVTRGPRPGVACAGQLRPAARVRELWPPLWGVC